MSNRTELRARLRLELGDSSSATVWSDDLLDALLIESVGWYSMLYPRQAVAYQDVAEAQRAFPLPPVAFGVSAVECPAGYRLPREAGGPVGSRGIAGQAQSWSTWGDTMYLGNPAHGREVGTGTLAMQVLLPWDRLDSEEQWNGPAQDERLLVLWSAAQAWMWLDGQDQKLGRPGRQAEQLRRCTEELQRELDARSRAARSRTLEY